MNWNTVKEWLETHEHINPAWDCIVDGELVKMEGR